MKLSSYEYASIAVVVLYVAFFTHPPPPFVSQILSNPLGHVGALALVLFATSKSHIVGLFVAIAYLLSTNSTLEYFDAPPPKKEEKQQPASAMVSPANASAILNGLLGKGGKIPSVAGKSVTTPPPTTHSVSPVPPSKEYTPVK